MPPVSKIKMFFTQRKQVICNNKIMTKIKVITEYCLCFRQPIILMLI